jgi:hypothetical protein
MNNGLEGIGSSKDQEKIMLSAARGMHGHVLTFHATKSRLLNKSQLLNLRPKPPRYVVFFLDCMTRTRFLLPTLVGIRLVMFSDCSLELLVLTISIVRAQFLQLN